MTKWVYAFGDGKAEGSAEDKALLGGKGANLAEMASIGLPVPPGFTLTTEVCRHFYERDGAYPAALKEQVRKTLAKIEKITGRRFGDTDNPLLVSVRSGAVVSMPGMMDTVLNLGLNDKTVQGLAGQAGDARFARDSYRRFIQMYGDVVLGVDHALFEDIIEAEKLNKGVSEDTELDADDLQALVEQFCETVERETGTPFPQDAEDQLWGAISAVFRSWETDRARTYRRLNTIPHDLGTAVTVQAMVFGNLGEDSATGVAFTRNPGTGERVLYGEFLVNAQGEDVVAGIRTPHTLSKAARKAAGEVAKSMEEVMPKAYAALKKHLQALEAHYRDMQDTEFTVERGRLWILQTRAGKRTARAALRIAIEMAGDGLITEEEAVMRVDPAALDQLLHPTLDPGADRDVITKGLPASPGAATGVIVLSADAAEKAAARGEDCLLVRTETSPEDIHGMHAARGIITSRGGMTSHAAVVARGMGRPCVAGAGELSIDRDEGVVRCGKREFRAGDVLTIDGGTGEVMAGRVAMRKAELTGDFATLMNWADRVRRMRVRTNAETPRDVKTAREFGAEGIGLCRTEHMFFDAERIISVREMILSDTAEGRKRALEKLLPHQRDDFTEIFVLMKGLPVTIRLLDPPLHEFLPREEKEFETLAKVMGASPGILRKRAEDLHEFNPMLGHRGCRLGISYPEIYAMQARAILEGAARAAKDTGQAVTPEIMIPLVMTAKELAILRKLIDETARECLAESGERISYTVGTMIELPRAALAAGAIAAHADFFSFGTNDLTQTTLGLSRDDSGSFLSRYIQHNILPHDPFVSLDRDGVGELVSIAAERGRSAKKDIKLGICGEHGGDPHSIRFCEDVGLDYVSCSPYRVPVARLAAAQAALKARDGTDAA